MDISAITQLISNVGFPVACTIALFYFWNKERESHKEEMNTLKDAINNNTQVMQRVVDKLGGVDSDGG